MKVHVLGGFLGAGKTTAMRALARHLEARGERVAIITNDQGGSLVDTALCRRESADVREIVGGCFCCRYGELEEALLAAHASGATVAVAEAVGSCTDLVATVLSPLADRTGGTLRVAPLSVVVDPWRVDEIDGFPEDVRYLFRKQIEEADVVVLSRADLDPPDVTPRLREIRSDVAIASISGTTGEGVAAWAALDPPSRAAPLDLDYDRYASAEALLGWCNARVRLVSDEGLDPGALLRGILASMRDAAVAHVKITGADAGVGTGAITRRGDEPLVHAAGDRRREMVLLVNARAAVPPGELEALVRGALHAAAPGARVVWEELACFRPGRPVPVHRYASRCGEDAACCAAFYARPDVRYLLGDSLHPGGVDLTLDVARELSLERGARVLDVACGNGTSLRALTSAYAVVPFGLDLASRDEDGATTIRRGDAHAIPFEDGSFDAILCECALSTFTDQRRALAEMRRALRAGGRLAVTDMVIEGTIPESLRRWIDVGTCLARARTLAVYERLVVDAGFRVVRTRDARDALFELLGRIKRALVGFALARASGQLPADVSIDVRQGRDLVREAEAAVRSGAIGYGVVIAERPGG